MTRLQLRNLVLQWLDDPNAQYFTVPLVNDWLNNAARKVQNTLIRVGQNFYVRRVQTPLVISQRDYVLPEDIKKINRLELITAGLSPNDTWQPVGYATTNQVDLLQNGTGTPVAYILRKSRISLYPAPSQVMPLRLVYTYLIPGMTLDTQEPDMPEAYHELIALYAAQDGFLKDGRTNELLLHKIKEYEDDFERDAAERHQDGVRQVVETGDYYAGYGDFWW